MINQRFFAVDIDTYRVPVAIFQNGKLWSWEDHKVNIKIPFPERRNLLADKFAELILIYEPQLILLEDQSFYTQKTAKDIKKLVEVKQALTSAAYYLSKNYLSIKNIVVKDIRVIDWKGNLSKKISHARTIAEVPQAKDLNSHMLDSVGIGLYYASL